MLVLEHTETFPASKKTRSPSVSSLKGKVHLNVCLFVVLRSLWSIHTRVQDATGLLISYFVTKTVSCTRVVHEFSAGGLLLANSLDVVAQRRIRGQPSYFSECGSSSHDVNVTIN